MLANMLVHVDQLGSLLGQLESDFLNALGGANDGEDTTVVVAVGLNVNGGTTGDGVRNINQSLEYGLVLFLGNREIRYTFDKLCHK